MLVERRLESRRRVTYRIIWCPGVSRELLTESMIIEVAPVRAVHPTVKHLMFYPPVLTCYNFSFGSHSGVDRAVCARRAKLEDDHRVRGHLVAEVSFIKCHGTSVLVVESKFIWFVIVLHALVN